MSLTNGLVAQLVHRNYTIPGWVLTTFNDYGDNSDRNVELRVTTTSQMTFSDSLNSIRFSGGGDAAEQATQGFILLTIIHFIIITGLLVTMRNMPKNGVVLVFTDNPSKNLGLQDELIALRNEKAITIFFVLAPRYYGTVNDASWKVFDNLSGGRIYNLANFDRAQFFNEVVQIIGSTCAGTAEADTVGSSAAYPASPDISLPALTDICTQDAASTSVRSRQTPPSLRGWETEPEQFFLPKEESPIQD